jgi:hypothetical protein
MWHFSGIYFPHNWINYKKVYRKLSSKLCSNNAMKPEHFMSNITEGRWGSMHSNLRNSMMEVPVPTGYEAAWVPEPV